MQNAKIHNLKHTPMQTIFVLKTVEDNLSQFVCCFATCNVAFHILILVEKLIAI